MKTLFILSAASILSSFSAQAYDYKLNDSVTYQVTPVTRGLTTDSPNAGQSYTKTVTVTKVTPGNDVKDVTYTLTTSYSNGAADTVENLKNWQVTLQTQNTHVSLHPCGQNG